MIFQFKTKPFRHQFEEWDAHAGDIARAIFWEQGTGKSKLILDTASYLYKQNQIDAVLVIAPNGVHDNWVHDEIPAHLSEDAETLAYRSSSAATKWHQAAVARLFATTDRLTFLTASYDALMTPRGSKIVRKLLKTRRVLYVLDESQRIKTPSAKRSIRAVASGKYAAYRRILSGTPVTNSPFDVYQQMKFLDPDFWKGHGFASYESFKTHFGHWEQRVFEDAKGNEQRFNELVYHKNVEQLGQIIQAASSRVTKDDVLDLPPKLYSKRYFDLSPEQARWYKSLREELMVEFDSGNIVTAVMAITRLLRFQQVTCGYLPDGDGSEDLVRLTGPNPRLKLLMEIIAGEDGPVIVYARFRPDIDAIVEALSKRYGDASTVRYDGRVKDKQRLENKHAFQQGRARFFVGNPAACGLGLTLTQAATVIYYSNSFNYEDRIQSEDRAHRIGQDRPVNYIDLVAKATVDFKIIGALRKKRDIASEITGDELREWI